jgi:hypothetical protein
VGAGVGVAVGVNVAVGVMVGDCVIVGVVLIKAGVEFFVSREVHPLMNIAIKKKRNIDSATVLNFIL